jgi:pyridoxal phosphate enzyme, yggS family
MNLKQNIDVLKEKVAFACSQAGRRADEITIVAASKTRPAQEINEALALGIPAYGENRVQELIEKYPNITSAGEAFFIGQLQSNKVKYIIDKVSLIQSVDRLSLAQEINRQALKHELVMPVLIEINIGRELSKGGVPPEAEALKAFCDSIAGLKALRLSGLMTVAPIAAQSDERRASFAEMYKLYGTFCRYMGLKDAVLSMGMSEDYIEAILEGSNMIRPGRALFGERK